jgi:hypothetical protein
LGLFILGARLPLPGASPWEAITEFNELTISERIQFAVSIMERERISAYEARTYAVDRAEVHVAEQIGSPDIDERRRMEAEQKGMSEREHREKVNQLECERPSGSGRVEVGGGDAQHQIRDAVPGHQGNL